MSGVLLRGRKGWWMVDWGLGSEGGGACARVRVCVCVRMRVGGGAWRCVCACTCACAWTCACVVCPFVKDVCVFHVSWLTRVVVPAAKGQ